MLSHDRSERESGQRLLLLHCMYSTKIRQVLYPSYNTTWHLDEVHTKCWPFRCIFENLGIHCQSWNSVNCTCVLMRRCFSSMLNIVRQTRYRMSLITLLWHWMKHFTNRHAGRMTFPHTKLIHSTLKKTFRSSCRQQGQGLRRGFGCTSYEVYVYSLISFHGRSFRSRASSRVYFDWVIERRLDKETYI